MKRLALSTGKHRPTPLQPVDPATLPVFDGVTPARGLTTTDAFAATPTLTGRGFARHPELYQRALWQWAPPSNPRYRRTSPPPGVLFVWDACRSLGVDIPLLRGITPLTASDLSAWFRACQQGWVRVSQVQASVHANTGRPTVAIASKHGPAHLAMVAPAGTAPVRLCGLGATSGLSRTIAALFGRPHAEFFSHP